MPAIKLLLAPDLRIRDTGPEVVGVQFRVNGWPAVMLYTELVKGFEDAPVCARTWTPAAKAAKRA